MFEDSLIESGGRLKTKRGVWTFFSFILEAILVGVLVLIGFLPFRRLGNRFVFVCSPGTLY